MAEATSTTIKLWDLPVRLVHWSLVLLMPALWWTGEEGDLDTHKLIGYAMLALVLFRLVWGLVGSATARFASFVKGPGAVLAYLRDQGAAGIGHNPVGALSVVLLLGLLAAQVGFGLIAQDVDGIESGPLNHLVSYDTAELARELHHLGFNLLLGLIAVHVLAIVWYRVAKRDDLVTPMVSGNKPLAVGTDQPKLAPLWLAVAVASASAAFAWWISLGAPLVG